MKILAIDISSNSSFQEVKQFLRTCPKPDLIYVFDHLYSRYESISDLELDMKYYPETFFIKPCAYYDMIIAILADTVPYLADSITVFSHGRDDCSCLSDVSHYHNYLRHYRLNCGTRLHFKSHPTMLAVNVLPESIPRHKFSLLEFLGLNEVPDDDDDDA